jgi:hypothetical protein
MKEYKKYGDFCVFIQKSIHINKIIKDNLFFFIGNLYRTAAAAAILQNFKNNNSAINRNCIFINFKKKNPL